eukprot:821951-Pleurochrysis_carterae.AAC.2
MPDNECTNATLVSLLRARVAAGCGGRQELGWSREGCGSPVRVVAGVRGGCARRLHDFPPGDLEGRVPLGGDRGGDEGDEVARRVEGADGRAEHERALEVVNVGRGEQRGKGLGRAARRHVPRARRRGEREALRHRLRHLVRSLADGLPPATIIERLRQERVRRVGKRRGKRAAAVRRQ